MQTTMVPETFTFFALPLSSGMNFHINSSSCSHTDLHKSPNHSFSIQQRIKTLCQVQQSAKTVLLAVLKFILHF